MWKGQQTHIDDGGEPGVVAMIYHLYYLLQYHQPLGKQNTTYDSSMGPGIPILGTKYFGCQ